MMRKVLVIAAVLSALTSANTAWAVLTTTSVVLTDQGRAIPGATITLSRPRSRTARPTVATPQQALQQQTIQQPSQQAFQQPGQQPSQQLSQLPSPPPVEQNWVVAKSDQTGRVLLQFDDKEAGAGTLVDITIYFPNGEMRRRLDVPIDLIRAGGAIEIADLGLGPDSQVRPAIGSTVPPTTTPDLKLIPAPPLVTIGSSTHQAQQDLHNPDRAYDPTSGQSLIFDHDKKTWVDTKTGQAIGFEGALAKDGTIIPAPPVLTARAGGKHQAQQDKTDPERAHDSVTGDSLNWDRTQSTWIDTKTQKVLGFQGVYVSGAAAPGPGMNEPTPPAFGFGFGFGFGSGSGSGNREDESNRHQLERRTMPTKP